ncbi:hypothetical protein BPMI_01229 [Candidatus Burkholderia pumila]|uniref:Death on curing protein, Doc toxin n=1 Tax=Candidatus Burkholderia pumila TaxID=1090375 RepID=A0ABR5HL21_9BURK|nr:hypothetical protein BPMI_01229 [Candidatus Burkholderia pumila]
MAAAELCLLFVFPHKPLTVESNLWGVDSTIADTIAEIKTEPRRGATPPKLADFRMTGYYEVTSGRNRIIYKVNDDTIYVHLVVDLRSDLEDILAWRLFRM